MNNVDPRCTWSDDQLADAVKVSTSWRGVMRELGLKATSAGSIRVVRRRAEELGLDASHFRGKRRWTDAQLRSAITSATSWDEVLTRLGLVTGSGSARTFIKGHAMRLGLDCTHLASEAPDPPVPSVLQPDLGQLRSAAPSVASAWFTLCGCPVSLPVEPTVYDLLCEFPDGIKRIQVNSTTYHGKGGWQVQIGRRPYSERNLAPLTPYDPDAIDFFFIMDGDLTMYLIPSRIIAGRVGILLRTYADYAVGNAAGMMPAATKPPASAA